MDDWEVHMSTVFPDVRMKKFLEMRGADGGPWKMICAMPALWVGLLYNAQAQREALDLISEWTVEEMTELRNEVRACDTVVDGVGTLLVYMLLRYCAVHGHRAVLRVGCVVPLQGRWARTTAWVPC